MESTHRDAIQMLDSEDENPESPLSNSSGNDDDIPEPSGPAPTRTRRRGVATAPVASDVTKPNSSTVAKRSMRLGLCGIRNYGNFCFVNAALQCLSHSVPLTEYFLAPGWQAHVNAHNKLGHGGKLARSFADFMNKLWVGDTSVLRPRKLLNQINSSDAGAAFLDGDQHDVHEFLSFMLDGLHEDLNRVKHGDVEMVPDSTVKSLRKGDGEVEQGFFETVRAAVAWNTHLQRNKSVIGAAVY
jgi:ubiquitin C-terminal hydrolase